MTFATRFIMAATATITAVAILAGTYVHAMGLALPSHFL
jgi:hypothetical protein